MRKYFLLGAVVMLMTTTANATTDYAEVTAKAIIEVAGTFTCEPINYGTIVVKQNNEEFVIRLREGVTDPNLISISDYGETLVHCEVPDGIPDQYAPVFSDVMLTNENGDTLTLTNLRYIQRTLTHELKILAEVKAGEYTGSFTITLTY